MQKTLQKSIVIRGIGLHSGKMVTLHLHPAPIDVGIKFVRADVTDRDNVIPALWDHVVDTQLCTVIANKHGVRVGTIEHIMAGLRGCGIDNVRIELNAPEVPIMDGSAAPFVHVIEQAGIKKQDAARKSIKILKTVTIEQDGKTASLSPAPYSTFGGEISFDHPEIGTQMFQISLLNGNFKHDLSEARTFGFLHEVEYMRSQGLALGGSLDNAIVLNKETVMNEDGLRFDDEFIRHKLLDAVGDLYLAGMPIIGAYNSYKAGHALNNALLHALFEDESNYMVIEGNGETPIVDAQQSANSQLTI